MTHKNKDLTKGLIGIAVGAAIAGPTIGIVQGANLPAPIRTGTTALIGVGLLKGASKLIK